MEIIEQFKNYCLENKYSKWYFSIVENAQKRNWNKKTAPIYTENHHIVPKSIIKNAFIVCLTAREHFIVHLLLPKMFNDKIFILKMYQAITAMKMTKQKRQIKNSRIFSILKQKNKLKGLKRTKKTCQKISESRKKLISSNKKIYNNLICHLNTIRPNMAGENNPMFGKRNELSPHYNKPKTKEHKEKIKNSLIGMKYSAERCKNMSINCPKNSLGKKWYHDPVLKIEKYFIEGTQPLNFKKGRLGV